MSNLNAKSINVGRLNVTEDTMYHRGRKVKMLDEDASGNLCLFNDSYPNNPLEIGINICPGTTVVSRLAADISATQIMSGALDVSGAIQLAFSPDVSADPSNNLGKIAFFPDSSNNYRFWCCEESRNNSGSVSNDVWRLLTSSFANQAYWTQTGTNLYYVGGNVGIGTKTPLSKLSIADVSGALGADSAGLAIGNSYANTYSAPPSGMIVEGRAGIGISNPKNTVDISNNLAIGNSYAGLETAPTNGMIVEGNVGIGTSSPNTNAKLDVSGSLLVGTGTLNSSRSAMIGDGNTMTCTNLSDGANFIAGHDCSLNGWCCSALGRHCVVNFPAYGLGDQGVALGNYAYAGFITGGTNIAFAVGAGEESQITEPTASLNNNKFVIDVCGNVGIGNGSLHSANIDISGNRGGSHTTAAVRMEYHKTNDTSENHGPFYMELGKHSNYPWPGHNFHRLRCEGGAKGGQKYAPLIFQVNSGNDVMILDSSSNVGIGTLEPTERLDVSGNVKIRNGYLDMSCNSIKDVSGLYFCGGSIDMSCNPIIKAGGLFFCQDTSGIDMSCNSIKDVSGLYFCGGSIDMSCNPITDVSKISFCSNGGGIDMSCNSITDVSGIFFCQDSSGIDMSCNPITDVSKISFCSNGGGIDMSCNSITDVSGIYFCDGSSFTQGNSLDISGDGISFFTKGSNVAKMTIQKTSGNMGIGTSTPTAKLEVNGDISGNSSLILPNIEINGKNIVSRSSDTTANIIIDPSNGFTNLTGDVRVQTPTKDTNPATKQYVDQTATGLKVQEHVSLATTTGNITPFPPTGNIQVDGSANPIVGSRILVKDQSDKTQNGVWDVSSGTWTRSTDFAFGDNVTGFYVFVDNGVQNLHTGWVVDGSNVIVGTSDITFNQFSSTGDIKAGTGLEKSGETLSVKACNGIQQTYNAIIIDGTSGNLCKINATPIGNDQQASGKFTTLVATTSITGALTGNADTATKIDSITNSDIVQLTATQTLTNKTLTSPTITGTGAIAGTFTGDITGNVTGNVTGNADTATKIDSITNTDIVQLTAIQTLTNKTLTSPTITGTGAIAGTFTGDITGNVTGNVTGNAATATKIDSITNTDIVQLTATQTLTNKTLTSPTLTSPTITGTLTAGGVAGTSGQVLSSTGSGLSWADTTEHGPWTTSGSDIYYNTGNVGIGASISFLEASGNIQSNNITFPGDYTQGDHDLWSRYSSNIKIKDRSTDGKGNNITISAGNAKGGVSDARGGDVVLKAGAPGNTTPSTNSYKGHIQFQSPIHFQSVDPANLKETSGRWHVEYSSSFMKITKGNLQGQAYLDFITKTSGYADHREGSILYLGMAVTNTPVSSWTIIVRDNSPNSNVPGAGFGSISLDATLPPSTGGQRTRVLTPPNQISLGSGAAGKTAGSILVLMWMNNMWKEVSYTP